MSEQLTLETTQDTPVGTPEVTPSAEPTPAAEPPSPPERQETEDNSYLLPTEPDDEPSQAQPEGLQSYLEMSPYINNPEALQGAIADSHLLHDIINGQQPVGNLLEGLRQAQPQAYQAVVNGLAQYISQVTGYQFVDPKTMPQQEVTDPVQQRLNSLEERYKQQQQQEQDRILNHRAQQAQGKMIEHLTNSLKGTFLEGENDRVLNALGSVLGDPMKVIEAIEKGDFNTINKALKEYRRAETDYYNRIAKRLIGQRQATAQAQPKVDNPSPVVRAKRSKQDFDTTTPQGRIALMNTL